VERWPPSPGTGPGRCLDAAAQARLVALVGQKPDVTLAELRGTLLAERGQRVCLSTVWRVLAEHDLRRKKALHAAERDTSRVVALRGAFVEALAQHEDPRRFKFVDETGLHLAFTRRYGRDAGGQRVGQGVPLRVGTSMMLVGH